MAWAKVEEGLKSWGEGKLGKKWERFGLEWEEKGEKERGIEGKKARQQAKVWEHEMVCGGGSGDYRLSGVFYLWSKCTLAFLLSSPQMQLDSSPAKQTQMKWLLNDFLGNPPQQRKPSIWSLLFQSLPPSHLPLLSLCSSFSSPFLSPFLPLTFVIKNKLLLSRLIFNISYFPPFPLT